MSSPKVDPENSTPQENSREISQAEREELGDVVADVEEADRLGEAVWQRIKETLKSTPPKVVH